MIDAVVLDVGGVLMDWDPRYLFAKVTDDIDEREWFLTNVCSPEWNRHQDAGRSWSDAVALAVADHPAYEAWIRTFDERWLETVGGIFAQTEVVLHEIRETSTPVYALTNFAAEKWALARDEYEVLSDFDGVVVSGEERLVKPDPAIYRLLLERFDLEPGRTFFTDDLPQNVDGARAHGIDAERFTDAATLRRQLVDRKVLDE